MNMTGTGCSRTPGRAASNLRQCRDYDFWKIWSLSKTKQTVRKLLSHIDCRRRRVCGGSFSDLIAKIACGADEGVLADAGFGADDDMGDVALFLRPQAPLPRIGDLPVRLMRIELLTG